MILVPELTKPGDAAITPMVTTKLAENERGAAILRPSGSVAKTWTDVAECPETTKAVAERVGAMQAGAAAARAACKWNAWGATAGTIDLNTGIRRVCATLS